MDYNLEGFFVHGISQARILKCVGRCGRFCRLAASPGWARGARELRSRGRVLPQGTLSLMASLSNPRYWGSPWGPSWHLKRLLPSRNGGCCAALPADRQQEWCAGSKG